MRGFNNWWGKNFGSPCLSVLLLRLWCTVYVVFRGKTTSTDYIVRRSNRLYVFLCPLHVMTLLHMEFRTLEYAWHLYKSHLTSMTEWLTNSHSLTDVTLRLSRWNNNSASVLAKLQWGQPICVVRGKICRTTTDYDTNWLSLLHKVPSHLVIGHTF